MKLTAEQHQKNLEELAKLTPEMMQGMTTVYLRRLLAGVNISNIKRGGELIQSTRARKDELITAIYEMTTKPRVLAQVELTELSQDDIRIGLTKLMHSADVSLANYANKLFEELRSYTLSQWDVEAGQWRMDTTYPQTLSLQLYVWLEAYRTVDGDELMGDTKVAYASLIRRTVLRLINENESTAVYYPQLIRHYEQMKKHNFGLLKEYNQRKLQRQDESAKTRHLNNQPIDPTHLLAHAVEVLASVTRGESPRWQDVSIALVLCTGRRPSEIHATAQFKVLDEYELEFTGQLKKKDCDTTGYSIPTLAPAIDCVNAHEYIKTKGRYYYGDQQKSHKSTSVDISRSGIKEWYSKYLPNVEDYIGEDGKVYKVRTHHRMREIYALITLERYRDNYDGHMSRRLESDYVGRILGHEPGSQATDSYDANFYIG